MKRLSLFLMFAGLFASACNGQKQPDEIEEKDSQKEHSPQTNIIVNKKYDEAGNLIRYDSSYTYYYSNIENDSLLEDSLLGSFEKLLQQKYPFSGSSFFNDFFFDDSLMHHDFYKNDFFSERFRQNREQMDKLFREMDQMKNQFFWDQFQSDSLNVGE